MGRRLFYWIFSFLVATISWPVFGQQNDLFSHAPYPAPATVGPAGYIGTSGPTGNITSSQVAPTGYDPGTGTGPQALPNSNALNVYPAATGPTGTNTNRPGVVGTTDYIVPRNNGTTGVTGLPGNMGWP
jgi:hypothetical protein